MAGRRKNKGEGRASDIGVVMTCSLFLIILTFFILLNSIAVIDERKQLLAIGSLGGSFGSFTGGRSPLGNGSSLADPSSPMIEQEIDFKMLLEKVSEEILDNVKIESNREQGIITINTLGLFDEKNDGIKPSKKILLDKLSSFVNKGTYPVEIVGHTDSRPAEYKGYSTNWDLTSMMALRVLRYFVDEGKVDPKRITAYGRGGQSPIASNETIESSRLNNRVDIILKFNMPDYVKKIYEDRSSGYFTYKRFNFKVF